MKPTLKTRIMALHPKNSYKFLDYSVQVFKHEGRQMKPEEVDFISGVQRLPLGGLALVLCKWEGHDNKLELFRIGMLFHIYRDDFDSYLKNNIHNPKVKRALEVWEAVKSTRPPQSLKRGIIWLHL